MAIVSPSVFATDPAAVEARWRPLTDSERAITPQLLDDAAGIIVARLPTVEARVLAGTLDGKLVQRVQAAMVKRVLLNPDGKGKESIDDYSWTRDNAVSAGLLNITDDEVGQLVPPRRSAYSLLLDTT